MLAKTRAGHNRGKLMPPRPGADLPTDMIVQAAGSPENVGILMSSQHQLTAVTPQRIENLRDAVMECGELAITRVKTMIVETPMGDAPRGLKDWTTSAAILIDKFAILHGLTAGGAGAQGVGDLEKRIALLLAAQTELKRRLEERDTEQAPLDVTPGSKPDDPVA
jgi:hypothetical protein